MGAYLSAPVKDKESEEGEDANFEYGVCAMQGWRTDMEDAHMVLLNMHGDGDASGNEPASLFGVFDGHGGKEVAGFCAAHLPETVMSTDGYRSGDMAAALRQAFLRIDELLVKDEYKTELKALMGSDEEEGGRGTMTINSSQLPGAVLDALGMGEEGGFVVKIVKAANGQMQIDDIVSPNGEGDGGEDAEAADPAETSAAGGRAAEGAPADSGNGKRRRREGAMQIDGPFSNVPQDGEGDGAGEAEAVGGADEEGGIVLEELSVPRTEEEWRGPSAGCTAVCAMVCRGELIVANAGDSRCVLSRGGKAVALTHDHKPMDPEEFARITKAGGFVADGRVNGSLNLSRALGDLEYKQTKELPPEEQMVTASPDIVTEKLQRDDEFIILACDGIWDVLSNQEAVDFVRERLQAGKTPKQICEDACDHCLAEDTGGCGKGCDNMSIVVAVLKGSPLAEKAAAARQVALNDSLIA